MGLMALRRGIMLNEPHIETESGDVATFSTDMVAPLKECVINIDPVQDLHGYDNPWAGGNGKNIFDYTVADYKNGYLLNSSGNESSGGSYRYTQSYLEVSASTTYCFQANKTSSTATALTACEYDSSKTFITRSTVYASASGTGFRSGTLTTGATTKYIRFSLGTGTENIMVEIGSSPSDYMPYSNICPISGWEKCQTYAIGEDGADGLSWVTGKYYNANGNVTSSSNTKLEEDYISVEPDKPYIMYSVKEPGNTNQVRIHEYNSSKTWKRQIESGTAAIHKWTSSSDAAYIRFSLPNGNTDIRLGILNADDTITFPQAAGTVYGGTLTINRDGSGALISKYDGAIAQADGTLKKLDGSSLSCVGVISSRYVYYTIGAKGSVVTSSAICNMYKSSSSVSTDNSVYVYNSSVSPGSARLTFKDTTVPNWTTVTTNNGLKNAWEAYVADQYANGNIIMAIWELTTPVEYTIPASDMPSLIKTLRGTNNIWADTGSIASIKYWTH